MVTNHYRYGRRVKKQEREIVAKFNELRIATLSILVERCIIVFYATVFFDFRI